MINLQFPVLSRERSNPLVSICHCSVFCDNPRTSWTCSKMQSSVYSLKRTNLPHPSHLAILQAPPHRLDCIVDSTSSVPRLSRWLPRSYWPTLQMDRCLGSVLILSAWEPRRLAWVALLRKYQHSSPTTASSWSQWPSCGCHFKGGSGFQRQGSCLVNEACQSSFLWAV